MTKPREFWIPRGYECDFHSGIHVIEYSAYENLQAELNTIKELLKLTNISFGLCIDQNLQAQLDIAMGALESISSNGNGYQMHAEKALYDIAKLKGVV